MQIAGTDLRLLRVFDAVVRHRGFAAAQAELNISQSTISNHILALENRLGVTLCIRGRGGFALTEQGRAVHEATRKLLISLDAFATDTEALRGRLAGTLRVGVVDSVASDPNFLLPKAVASFERRSVAVRFEFLQGSPQTLQTQVLEGSMHLAIGSFPHKVRGLSYRKLYDEVNTLYCGQRHPLFGVPEEAITAESLRVFKAAGRSYWRPDHRNNQDFANSPASAQGVEQQLILILSGAFLGYLPDHVAARWVEQGALRRLRPDLFTYSCQFDVATRPKQAAGALAGTFLEDLASAYGLEEMPEEKAQRA
jgi:DNA-binding transcriptional LysR family regulator